MPRRGGRYDPAMLDDGAATTIAAAFGLGDDPVLSDGPVARGEQGQIWRLETNAGSWAVKEGFRPVAEAGVRFAAAFSDAARALGVPSPRAVAGRDGRLIADLGRTTVRVSEWVDLLEPDIRLDPATVGRVLAGLHRARIDGHPDQPPQELDPWFTEPVGRAGWDELVGGLRAAGAPFAEQLAAMREEFVALDAWVEAPGAVQTCHRDLWADNLRPTAAGGACVIDWEDCGPADPSQELGCLLVEFGGADPARIRRLFGSYLEHGGPGRVTRRGDFSMLIAQLGHICQIACTDWLDPTGRATDRTHSAERFAEFVERPHTRAGLELILDALR